MLVRRRKLRRLDKEELICKLRVGGKYAEAREMVLQASDEWKDAIRRANPVNLLHRISRIKFITWLGEDPTAALHALRALWATDGRPLAERIKAFCEEFPTSVVNGAGTRANIVSVLLMGENVEEYPPLPHRRPEAGMRANRLPTAEGSRERGGVVRARARLSGQVHRGSGRARSPGAQPAACTVHHMGERLPTQSVL